MTDNFLKDLVTDQRAEREALHSQLRIIPREGLEQCRPFLAHPNILLITGMRRAGKSFFSHLLAQNTPYAFINFDDERLLAFSADNFDMLMQVFHQLYGSSGLLLFDEIQNIPGWEFFVNRIRSRRRIIITGSNARLLSSEMSTHLTGRFDTWSLFPLSFREFLCYRDVPIAFAEKESYSTAEKAELAGLFHDYLRGGGIFEYYLFGKAHIRNLVMSIVSRDIISRHHIGFPAVLENLAATLITSFASRISVNKLAGRLNVKSPHTIQEYINYLEKAYLLFSVAKFSFSLNRQQTSFKKIYVYDNGIIDSMAFSFSENKGRLLENCVAIELLRRSKTENITFYYWDNYRMDCDFVLKRGNSISLAIQVCYELTPENETRELRGLEGAIKELRIPDGIILTANQDGTRKINGHTVRVIPVWRWLPAKTENGVK